MSEFFKNLNTPKTLLTPSSTRNPAESYFKQKTSVKKNVTSIKNQNNSKSNIKKFQHQPVIDSIDLRNNDLEFLSIQLSFMKMDQLFDMQKELEQALHNAHIILNNVKSQNREKNEIIEKSKKSFQFEINDKLFLLKNQKTVLKKDKKSALELDQIVKKRGKELLNLNVALEYKHRIIKIRKKVFDRFVVDEPIVNQVYHLRSLEKEHLEKKAVGLKLIQENEFLRNEINKGIDFRKK